MKLVVASCYVCHICVQLIAMLCFHIILSVIYAAGQSTAEQGEQLLAPTFFVNHIFEKYGNKKILTYEGFEHLLENLGLGGLTFEQRHDVSLHQINGTFYEIHDEQELHHHSHGEKNTRDRRHIQSLPTSSQHGKSAVPCLSPQQILETYGLEPSHGLVISHDHFLHICPAIVYELDQKHCWQHHVHKNTTEGGGMKVWLEASISILIMSIAGLLCAAIVPVLNGSKGGELLNFLVAVAAGTLAGDAVIHLLPQAFQYNPQVDPKSLPILRATVTLLSIITFYIIENILCIIQEKKRRKLMVPAEENNMLEHGKHYHGESNGDNTHGALACIVIVGDILHNVTDGLSIGAAFSVNSGTGIACATAVFCHELPHELGDYALLLQEGISIRRALLWNIFSSLFSFGGMALGLVLGELLNAAPWINAFTAGSFLYIALANLVPSLKAKTSIGNFLFQILGLSAGIILMVFIGLYEHQWEMYLTQ